MPDPRDYKGRTLLDSAGEKVGVIEDVYVDQQTKKPEWVLVKADPLRGRKTFVPLPVLRWEGDQLQAPYRKEQITSAPYVGDGEQAAPEDEKRLFQHYGIPYSGAGTVTSEPERDFPRGPEPTDNVQRAIQDQAQQVSVKAREMGGTVQAQVRQQVDARSTQVGEQVDSVSQAMRGMGDQLRNQGNDLPAQLAHQAAGKAEELGRYLREADADRILGDVEDFGRRQPWVMVAAGVALGIAAARFLKASSRQRYESVGYGGQEVSRPGSMSIPKSGEVAYGTAAHQEPVTPLAGEQGRQGSE
jgi:sporulation protein YlmC with PRC-barrel domain